MSFPKYVEEPVDVFKTLYGDGPIPWQKARTNLIRWAEALESGDYLQGRQNLRIGNEFCCVGVACDLFDVPSSAGDEDVIGRVLYEGEPYSAPPSLYNHLPMSMLVFEKFVELNDEERWSFRRIAQLIRWLAEGIPQE